MKFWITTLFIFLFITISVVVLGAQKRQTIKVGLLYSKTGTMSNEEKVIANMLHFAVDELNENGGVLNRKVEIIEYDGASDPKEFAKGASSLIAQGANTIFGCWTSASRKAVKPVVEAKNALLIYPVQYEGVEASKNILYLGATPNQQVNPTLSYIKQHYGNTLYLVGSDYIYPRMTDVYIKELSHYIGFNILGSTYLPLGSDDFNATVHEIQKSSPDAIINTLNGTSNIAFFKALHDANITAQTIPVFSLSLDQSSMESIASHIGLQPLLGNFATWGYFDTIASNENHQFIQKVSQKLGKKYRLTDAGYLTYLGFQFWKKGVEESQKTDTKALVVQIHQESLNSLFGIVYIDKTNNHLTKTVNIASFQPKGFQIVWSSITPTLPHPYPSVASKEFWDESEVRLFKSWNNHWEAPRGKQ